MKVEDNGTNTLNLHSQDMVAVRSFICRYDFVLKFFLLVLQDILIK